MMAFTFGLFDLILTDADKNSFEFAFLQLYQIKIIIQWVLLYLQIFNATKQMQIARSKNESEL
jgi:hypothetical protein